MVRPLGSYISLSDRFLEGCTLGSCSFFCVCTLIYIMSGRASVPQRIAKMSVCARRRTAHSVYRQKESRLIYYFIKSDFDVRIYVEELH